MRFITPIILIAISITVFFVFISPLYQDISKLHLQVRSYNEALDNSKALENERDKLTAKYNSINPDNLIKLEKLLPENIDNIRLILEIEQIAMPYGMVLREVKYNTDNTKDNKTTASPASPSPSPSSPPINSGAVVGGGVVAQKSNKDYGSWDLEFSTVGSYNNFINFTKDLERNLRIVDISSITFSSGGGGVGSASSSTTSDSYKYNFKVKTYWLKD